jgi:hypothetical protein
MHQSLWVPHLRITAVNLLTPVSVNFDESKVPNFPALLTSFTALRHLELRLSTSMVIFPIEGYNKNELHPNRFPHLRALILDGFSVVQSERVKDFWRCHPGLEILGLGPHLDGVWFEGFTGDMLPNLTVLRVRMGIDFNRRCGVLLLVYRALFTMRECFSLM